MKLYFSKFIFFIFLALVSCSKPDAYDSQGNPISLKQYQGKWIIINYWASWCGPCLEEMPTLNKLYHEYPNQLIILGVSFDGLNAEKINESAKKLHVDYPLLSSFPLNKLGVAEVPILPTSFIVNPEGKFIKMLTGPQNEAEFKKAVSLLT